MPVEYWTDISRVTYYTINAEVFSEMLDVTYNPVVVVNTETVFTKIPKQYLCKSGNSIYQNTETVFTSNITKNTKDDDKEEKPPSSFLISEIEKCMDLIPEAHRKKNIEAVIKKAVKNRSIDYIERSVLYTIDHTKNINPKLTTEQFKAYLGKTIDNNYAEGWEVDEPEPIIDHSEVFKRMGDNTINNYVLSGNKWAKIEQERRFKDGKNDLH